MIIAKKFEKKGNIFVRKDCRVAASYYNHENSIVLWRLKDEKNLHRLDNVNVGYEIKFLPNQNKLLFVHQYNTIQIWDWENDKVERLYEPDNYIECIEFSKDGLYFGITFGYGNLMVWNVQEKKIIFSITHHSSIESIMFNTEGVNEIICGTKDGSAAIWNLYKKVDAKILQIDNHDESCLIKCVEKKNIFAAVYEWGFIVYIDSISHRIIEKKNLLSKLWCVEFSQDCEHFVAGCRAFNYDDFSVKVYDTDTITTIRCITIAINQPLLDSVAVWRVYWKSANIIYAVGHDESLTVLEIVDFNFVAMISAVLLCLKTAPYVTLDIVNFLLAHVCKTSFALESKVLLHSKIRQIERQNEFLRNKAAI